MSLPNQVDFLTPFDPTGYTTITGAQLEQLVSGVYPNTGIGLCVVSADSAGVPNVPNASSVTKWQNYIWIRQTATSVIPYIWNPVAASDATLLQWQTIAASSIGVGTIVNSMIQANTITYDKIASVSWNSIINAPTLISSSTALGGSLSGTLPNPTIANSAITSSMFAAGAVNNAALGSKSVAFGNMLGDGTPKDMMRAGTGGDATVMEWFTPPSIFTSSIVTTTSNVGKVPQVATSGASDTGTWQMVALPVLQIQTKTSSASVNSSGALSNSATNSYAATGNTGVTGLDTAITPNNTNNRIVAEAIIDITPPINTASFFWAYLYSSLDSYTTPIASFSSASQNLAQATTSRITLKASVKGSIGTSAITFKVAFGQGSGTAVCNIGGALQSMILTEYTI